MLLHAFPHQVSTLSAHDDERTYHVGIKRGDVAPRILTVGSARRAHVLSALLHPPAGNGHVSPHITESSRGFVTATGTFPSAVPGINTPVSVICTHMGAANMDFVIRECAAVIQGPMAVVRLGTCGGLQPDLDVGTVVVCSPGSISVRRNPDAFGTQGQGPTTPAYSLSQPVLADPGLSAALLQSLRFTLGEDSVVEGLNASADSFYSSQGRPSRDFDDRNEHVLTDLLTAHPGCSTLEMETFHLLDLARCSRGRIKATAAAIVLAQRVSHDFLDQHLLLQREMAAGRAALAALANTPLDSDATS